jgi:hypothetical protein
MEGLVRSRTVSRLMVVIPEATASGDILRNHQGPLHFRFCLEIGAGCSRQRTFPIT